MPQDLIIGAKTGGSSNLLRINDTSRRFSFRDVNGSWKEAASVDFAIFEKPDEVSRFLVLELSANADYSPAATLNSQTNQANFIYYDGAAWSAFPAGGISPTALGTLVAFNFAAVAKNLGDQIFFRFWWSDGQITTEKKASIFPAMSLTNSGASSAAEVETATDSVAGIARAATQTEVDDGTAGFIFVTPATLNAKKFAASKITGLAAVATSGDYNDLNNKYELPAASASTRGGIKVGSNINLTNGDVISVSSASASAAGVVQLASSSEVTAGTNNSKAVTPAGLKVELDKKANSADLKAVALSGSYNDLIDKPEIPEVVAASTTAAGIVRLATAEEAAGELTTIAVTPAGLNSVLSGYYTSAEIDNKLSVVIRYKGVRAAEAELPSSGNVIGDFWLVSEDSSEYVWNGTTWEKFGATISLDGYLTIEAAAQTYVAKTQLATSTSAGIVQIGQNININSGIISVSSASTSTAGVVQLASSAEITAGTVNNKAVTPAGLKVELDKKVNSAALAAVATSGDYNDLSNKYELPAATSAAIGGVKPGGNLTVTADGTLNFTGFGAQGSDGSSLSSEIKILKAGSGTQFSYSSGVLTIGLDSSVTGGLTAVSHDSTLAGQGTSADPLKVNAATEIAAKADASDDKIPTELAVRKAIDSQKVTRLVIQRGVSDKALYPKLVFSASADFSSPSEFDFSSSDFARLSAKVFNGTSWVAFPAEGLDAQFDNKEIAIDVAVLLGDAMPQLPFYVKFCWIESNGTASEYKSSVFPAAPSFAPAADVVDEERLLPTGGVTGNVLKIDSSGKAIWSEGVDESRLLKVPTSADEGKLPVIRADKIPAVYHDTTLAAIVIEGDKVIDKISGKELTKVGSPQIIDGGIHSPTNSDYYMLELEGVEGLPMAVSFDYQGDEPLDNSDVLIINGNYSYYNLNGVSFCRTQGSGNNVKIDNQPISVSEAYRNYVMQVSSDNYESKTPPVAFIAGESKSPTYEGSFPSMSPLSSVKVCGRFGKIKNILISSAFPYTGNFTPRGDGVEGFGVPEKREPGWNYETLNEAANGRLLPENPANGDIPCFDATATIGGGNDANTKALLHFDVEVKDEAAGNAAPLALSSLNATIDTTISKFGSGSLKLTNGHVFVPISDLTAVNCVISCWVYLDSLPSSYSPLFCQDDDTAGSWNLAVDNSGIYMFCRGGTTKAKQPLQAKTWYWAAIVKSGKELRFYLNGAYIYSLTDSILRFTNPIIGIGEQTNEDGRKLTGNVDEFRIQFLTADELSAWTGLTIPVPVEAYSVVQMVGEWGKFNKSELVQSVNGVAPDESGNVVLDASTIIDNSRLLPVLDTLPEGYEGSLLAVQRGDGKVADENTLRLMHFNDDVRDVVTDETGTLKGNASITSTGYFAGALSINHAVVSSLSFNGLTATPTAWTMDFRVKLGRFSGNAPLILIGTNLNETQTSIIRVDSSYIDIQATYNQRVIYQTHSLQLDTWYHFALTYDGTTYKFYIDGKLFGSGESENHFDFTRKLWFGSFYDYSTSYVSDCTIDEFRLSNVVRWTENFTPPDKPYGESLYNWGIGPKLDESRLLPKVDSVPTSQSGHALVYDYQSGIDADTLCLLHLDDSTWADATGKNTVTQHSTKAKVADNGYFDKALDLTANSSGAPDWLTVPWLSSYESDTWTMEFFAKPTKSVINFMFFSFGNSQGSYLSLGSQSLTNLWLGNGSGTYTGNFSFSLNTWYWIVMQYDGTTIKVYVDTQLVVQGNFTPNYIGQDLQFGNLNLVENSDNTFIGYLDEFRWSKGLRYPTGVMEIPTQPFGSSQARFKVAAKGFVPSDSRQLLPANPSDYDLAIYRVFPEEAAPQNLTSATSDPNWEVTWSGAYSGRVGWQAFDSDQGTTWCTYSAAVGDWLCWEYKGTEGSVLLRRYSIAKGSGNGDCPTGWKIQGSNDGAVWIDIDEQTGQSFPNNDAKEYTIPGNSTPYKFHRFYLLSWNTSNMIGTFKAWSWINSTDECNRWVTVDIADLQGTSENEITLVRPVSDQSLFPIIEASADVGFTSVQTINTRTVADDRAKVKAFNGSAFADFPDSGLGTPYDEQSVVVDVSSFIAALGDSFYVRYKWESSDGTASDYKAAKFPLSVAQTPVASTGGGTGNVSYQTLEIPAQDSWTTDSLDTTRKYLSVASGRCSCIVYDANGIEVGIEVQYVSSTNETRLLIPADLTAGTITTGWTCRYAQISEN